MIPGNRPAWMIDCQWQKAIPSDILPLRRGESVCWRYIITMTMLSMQGTTTAYARKAGKFFTKAVEITTHPQRSMVRGTFEDSLESCMNQVEQHRYLRHCDGLVNFNARLLQKWQLSEQKLQLGHHGKLTKGSLGSSTGPERIVSCISIMIPFDDRTLYSQRIWQRTSYIAVRLVSDLLRALQSWHSLCSH